MLVELTVRNIVIVAEAHLRPGPGLCVVSGETGAGKSLLVDALEFLLGARSSADLVGPAGDEAEAAGVFSVPVALRRELAEATGLDLAEDPLVIRRRLRRGGRSQAWINEQPVSAAGLRTCGGRLVEMRFQHEHLALAAVDRQLTVIDRYGGQVPLAADYAAAHAACCERESGLRRLEDGDRDSVRELAHLTRERDEIAALDPRPGGLAELVSRQALLAGAQEWRDLAGRAVDRLLEGDGAVQPAVVQMARRLVAAPDDGLREAGAALVLAAEHLQEAGRRCARAVDEIHADPGELAEADRRLGLWHDLLRRHGGSEESLLANRMAILDRIRELETVDERRAAAAAALAAARDHRDRLGRELAAARERAAAALAQEVRRHLRDLGMPQAELGLRTAVEPAPTSGTWLPQELVVRTNPGIPAGPLGAVASGGESARLGLALALVLAAVEPTGAMVFDEVDAGVGGRLGGAIAEKLVALAADRTVIAVTHSPQIAARAAVHYRVVKRQTARRTRVEVERVADDERRQEIAEMLGGGPAALIQAEAMLTEGLR
jgi:DNA repair protein RecN (Recombination protein N)